MRTLAIPTALICGITALVGCDRQDRVPPTSPSVELTKSPPGQAPIFGTWHRLNTDQSNPTPEHEVRWFRQERDRWVARYDKHPEPKLGFENPPDGTFGNFRLTQLTDPNAIACLEGLPFDCPGDVVLALAGEGTYYPETGDPFTGRVQHLVLDRQVLWELWLLWPPLPTVKFACPSFRTFDEALAANPFPLPFNGEDWPAFDCVVVDVA